jgi:hypothetical protein
MAANKHTHGVTDREMGELSSSIAHTRHNLANVKHSVALLQDKVAEQGLALSTLKTRLNTTIAVGFGLVNLVGLALNWVRTMT